jgi:hypothetical protein
VIDLIAESAPAKTSDDASILEIVVEHDDSLLLLKPGTPVCRREWNSDYYVAAN